MARADNPDFVEALERGLEVIRALGKAPDGLSLSQVAEAAGLPRPTARRALVTLETLGYVRSEERVFRLTPRVLDLGYSFLSGLGLPDVALPHLERLVAQVDESSEASVLDGEDIRYIVRVPSTTIMTLAINVGGRMPAHATSMGKVLLAGLADDELDEYLGTATLTRHLERTITDPDVLRDELMRVREQGYAIVDQELEEGLIAIAVPVRDRAGRVVAAINLSTHVARRSVESLREDLLAPLLETARTIEIDFAGVSSNSVPR
jgi:IclR family transcriptional regulator, pca regulon regulatory protein